MTSLVVTVLATLALGGVWRRRPDPTDAAAHTTDPVTGLENEDSLARELAARFAEPDAGQTLLLLFDLYGFKAYNDDFGREAGDRLLARLAKKLARVAGPVGKAYRLTGDEFALVVPIGEGEGEATIEAARAALSVRGDGFRVGCSFGGALVPFEASDGLAALELARRRLASHRRTRQRARTMSALADALSRQGGANPLTRPVESLAVAVGGLLGLSGNRLEALARAVELHDVGQLSVPSEILDKPGPLDEAEWEFVRQQTLVAEQAVDSSPHLWGVAPIVRATYENWDGTGHPDGLAGEDIPIAARIIRVCQAYYAMTSERPYRPALEPAEALVELESRTGTMFDPAVVRILSALVTARDEGMRAA